MMKKIFLLVAFFVLGKMWSYAQYPITQNIGADSTIVVSKGALQSRLINMLFTDTAQANTQRIRQYAGAQIATTTGGNLNLWVRNATATAWLPINTGSGNNIYTIDGTLLGNRTLTGAGYSLTFNQLSKLLFNADSTTINTDQATILNNGVSTLNVKGATGRIFLMDTTAPADERIYELKSSNGEFYISILNDAQTSNDSAFLITSASRVGINTLNPDSTLKVGGGVNILGGLRVGDLPTSPGTKQLRINAQGQFSVTDTLIDAGGTVTSVGTNNGSGITGGPITTTGTLAIDTTNVIATKASVSGGLAGKLNLSDTAAMLAPYLRAIDTASLSNRINTKLNISDTATMLGNYLNNVGYGLSKAGQVASADSATLSAYYLRRKDSLTVTNPLGYVTQKILADTAAAIRSSDLGGTVTSVATNNGTGITGGTITTSGTLAIDTTVISTRAWRQKGVDSVAALANTKISGSLISGYLTKATGTLTVDTSQLYQSSGLIGIGTTSPTQKLQVSGSAYVNGQLFAGDTALSVYQVEGILNTPYVLGRKAVNNTLSTEARPTGVMGHVVGRGSIANRLQAANFYTTTDSASTANSTGSLRSVNAWTAHNGSGSLTTAWGSYNIVQNKTTGTITNAYGSVSGVENRGATSTINKLHGTTTEIWNNYGGTIDTAFGQVISIYNNNAASNIGAVYGLSIGKGLISASGGTHYWRNSGTIGTSYGLYLDSSIDVGTTKYALFSNSNSNSYFRAKLGIGTTSPDSAFQVATGAYFQRGIRASGLPQAAGTKALRIDASGTISYADTLIDAGGTVTSVATNNGTGITGGTITTSGTLAIDTLLISTRAWRQKGVDSLQANINLKLNISDTASMLSPYLRKADTIAMLNPYFRLAGVGLKNTGQTVYADTLLLSTRAWRQKGIDSVAALANTKISGSLISGYLTKATGTLTVDTSQIYQNNGNIGIGTISPASGYKVDMVGSLRVGNGSSYNKLTINGNTVGSYLNFQKNGTNKGDIGPYSAVLGGVPPYSGSNDDLTYSSVGGHFFNTNAGVKMYLNNAGNLGLSASPDSMLTVLEGAYFQRGVRMSGLPSAPGTKALRINANGTLSVADTLVDAGGTVTSVATNNGTGITGGTITTTGTLAIDTLLISTRAWRQKGIDSVAALINSNVSGTTNYVAKFTGTNTIGNSQLFDNGTNVGIGTTSPATKLDVNGITTTSGGVYVGTGIAGRNSLTQSDFRIAAPNDANILNAIAANASMTIKSDYYGGGSATPLILQSGANSNQLYLATGGNVGIGTTSPVEKLDVNGNITITNGNYVSLASNNPTYTRLYRSGGLLLENNTFQAILADNGNFGIGTTSPGRQLEVYSATTDTRIAITNTTSTSGAAKGLELLLAGSDGYAYNYANGALILGTNASERMRITSGGNVLVGTTTDAGYKLDVNGIVRATGETIVSGGTLYLNNTDNSQAAYLVSTGTGGSAPLIIATNSTERMRITSGGSVGIGTSSPQAKLQVTNSTSDGIIVSTTANVEPFLAFWRNSASNGVGVLRLIDGGNLYFDNGATGAAQATKMQIAATGAVRFNAYGAGSFTGTRAYDLSVDASGNIIEVPVGAGTITGSGTTNYIPKFTSSSAIGNSAIYDASGNIGIATITNVTMPLTVQANTGNGAIKLIGTSQSSSNNAGVYWYDSDGTTFNGYLGNFAASFDIYNQRSTPIVFYTNAAERMRLDASGNLGLGTSSPAAKLHVAAAAVSGTIDRAVIIANSSASGSGSGSEIYLGWNSPSINAGAGVTIGASYAGGGTNMLFSTPSSIPSAPNVKMTLDGNGNLGLGVTPSAWTSTWRAIQLPGGSIYSNAGGTTGQIAIGQNWYYDGSQNRYINSAAASDYYQFGGEHRWFNAPSGTAGNAISFTQAMTLDASGRLGIGTSSPTQKLVVDNGASSTYIQVVGQSRNMYLGQDATGAAIYSDGAVPMYFSTNAAERMRLDASGNLGLGTSSPLSDASTKIFTIYDASQPRIQLLNSTSGTSLTDGVSLATVGLDFYINNRENGNVLFFNNGAERMRLDASGNLGLGVTPSAWGSGFKAFQIATGWLANTDGGGFIGLLQNAYYNGSSYIYGGNGAASLYYQQNGQHIWQQAASGTAGNAISFTQAMTLDASGRLGIGTTSPASKLEVYGTATASASTSDAILKVNSTATNAIVFGALSGSPFATYIQSGGSNTYPLSLNPNGGNVLVGTTTDAGYKLDVNGSGRFNGVLTVVNPSNPAAGTIEFGTSVYKGILDYSASTGLWNFNNQSAGPSTTNYFQFQADGTPIITMRQNGNVGIGTTSPDSLLTVQTGAWVKRGLRLSGLPSGIGTKELRIDANGVVYANDTLSNDISGSGTTNYIPKFTSSSAIGNSIVQDNATGIVIAGTDNFTAQNGGWFFNGSGSYTSGIFASSSSNNLTLRAPQITIFESGGSERMRLDASGNLGLGNSAPSYKLDVSGTARFTNSVTFASGVYNYIGTNRFFAGADGSYNYLYTGATALSVLNQADNASLLTLTNSGNLGLGVTPNTWGGTGVKAFQFQNGSLAASLSFGALFGWNTYYDGSYRYVSNSSASAFLAAGNDFIWYQAPSGTAGNAISFTQAMTLFSTGNLAVGGTSDNGSRLNVTGSGYFSGGVTVGTNFNVNSSYIGNADATTGRLLFGDGNAANAALRMVTNSTSVFYVDAVKWGSSASEVLLSFQTNGGTTHFGGNVGIGTTSPGAELVINSANSNTRFFVQNAGSTKIELGHGPTGYGFTHPTGQFLAYADNLYFGQLSGVSTNVTFTGGGNVLIGSTSDAGYKLDVNGTTRTTSFLADYATIGTNVIGDPVYLRVQNYNTGGYPSSLALSLYGYATSSYFDMLRIQASYPGYGSANFIVKSQSSSSDVIAMTIKGDGQIGIGNTSPAAKLDIGGATVGAVQAIFGRGNDDNNFTVRYTNGTSGTNNAVQGTIGLDYASGTWADMAAIKFIRNSTAGELSFFTSSSAASGTEKMRITSAGNVGIGTSSPAGKLEIVGSSGGLSLKLPSGEWYGASTTNRMAFDNPNQLFHTGGSGGAYKFRNAADGADVMTITNTGNVGIGTSSPNHLLELNGGSSSKGIQVLSSDNPYIQIQATNNPTVFKLYANDVGAYVSQQSNYPLIFNTNSTERMRITSGGNVLVGTTTDAGYKLDVNGTGRFSGALSALTDITVTNSGAQAAILQAVSSYADGYRATLRLNNTHTGGKMWDIYSTNNSDGVYGGGKFVISNATDGNSPLIIASTGAATFSSSVTAGGDLNGGGNISSNNGFFAIANGNQTANTESAIIYLGNRGYFAGATVGAAKISAISTGANWYSGTAMAFYTNPGPDVTGTGSVERMRITSGGNVGIGTTSPYSPLDVYTGANYLTVSTNDGVGSYNGFGLNFRIASTSHDIAQIRGVYESSGAGGYGGLMFATKAAGSFSNRVYIQSDGNVGIGTTSPTNRLTINGTNIGFDIQNSGSTYFRTELDGGNTTYLSTIGAYDMILRTNSNERMRITSTGNVLVGSTTDGGFKLYVNGTTKSQSTLYLGGNTDMIDPSSNSGFMTIGSNQPIRFTNASTTEYMRITTSGIVGIGTSSPDASVKLQVESSSSSSVRIVSSAASGGDLYITSVNGSGESKIDKQGAAGPLTFYNNGSERMRLTSSGELLINTTTDAGAYYLQVNGDVYASAYYESSDLRLKNVLSERKGSDGINTIAFKWKDGRDSLTHIGYAAQQVEKVLPDAVKTNPNGYKTINYDEVQSLKIANLEQEIAELKKIIKQLIDKK